MISTVVPTVTLNLATPTKSLSVIPTQPAPYSRQVVPLMAEAEWEGGVKEDCRRYMEEMEGGRLYYLVFAHTPDGPRVGVVMGTPETTEIQVST